VRERSRKEIEKPSLSPYGLGDSVTEVTKALSWLLGPSAGSGRGAVVMMKAAEHGDGADGTGEPGPALLALARDLCAVAVTVITLIPRSEPAHLIAFHRFVEVTYAVACALAYTVSRDLALRCRRGSGGLT